MENEEKTGKRILNFFIKTMNGMAYGLFATLIAGTILGTIGWLFTFDKDNQICKWIVHAIGDKGASGVSQVLQMLTGAGIGIGIAISLKFDAIKTIVLGLVGETASFFSLSSKFVTEGVINDGKFQIGDPLTVYFVCIAVALAMIYVLRKKTPVDIILIPVFGTLLGLILSLLIRFPSIYVTFGIQWVVSVGTEAIPLIAGIVVAVLMGMSLTAPISSAAIAAIIFTSSDGSPLSEGLQIASGAAIVGCCCQMIGFAIQSRKDNPVGIVISVGIGTSMLQFKNILKKPIIWLPTIIASAILGPIATCLVKTVCLGSSAGMGTAGLVGIIGTFESMGFDNWNVWVSVVALELILPGAIVFGLDFLFRKIGWIKEGDLKV